MAVSRWVKMTKIEELCGIIYVKIDKYVKSGFLNLLMKSQFYTSRDNKIWNW